jgi:hypothetical protein
MQVRRLQMLATEMIEIAEGCEPAEFQAALTLATAIYFKTMFPKDLESIYRLHIENLRAAIEELDSKDTLELHGLTI